MPGFKFPSFSSKELNSHPATNHQNIDRAPPPPTYNEATGVNTEQKDDINNAAQFVDTSQVKPKKQHKGGFGFGLPSFKLPENPKYDNETAQVKTTKQKKGCGLRFGFKGPSFKGTSSSPAENVGTTVVEVNKSTKQKKQNKSGSGFHFPSFS